MRPIHKRVLILNADYTAWSVTEWQDAIVKVLKFEDKLDEGLQDVDFYKNDYVLTSGGRKLPIPAVCRMINYQRPDKKTLPFSRTNVFIRDKLTCQYCGFNNGTTHGLTYDHVYPRVQWKKEGSVGTPTHWTNIVTACIPCNRRKGGKSLTDSGMTLSREPTKPGSHNHIVGITPWDDIPDEWLLYLPPFYKEMAEQRKARRENSRENS